MAIIKCKMCGGDIELAADKTFGTCEFCGSTMTFPKVDDEQRAAAFNRGNHFRRTGEFDKALAVYERIATENDADAEAHWCCALCRFGIEYVEDPATYEWIPTCHRASFDSFLEDVDYLAALEHSDGVTKRQYQKDAARIAEVQRGILATSQREEPFDVFICYKETDENGNRTTDSQDAQELYYRLTDAGYRVFFSRITLEDKGGAEYEPYIFAALNSAKVMIVVGSKAAYFNAVWVKNEWSRFLSLMKKDRNRLLLPCYRNMDPYDLPEQLSVLQSYDLARIGVVQDLLHGIKKVLDADKKPEIVHEVVSATAQSVDPLIRRGQLFLEDGDWKKADEYFDKALDIDPENSRAYVGKLCALLHYKKLSAMAEDSKTWGAVDTPESLENSKSMASNLYEKAVRFGDSATKDELDGLLQRAKAKAKYEYCQKLYNNAVKTMNRATEPSQYESVAKLLEQIEDYRDSAQLKAECLHKAKELMLQQKYNKAMSAMKQARTPEQFAAAANLFDQMADYQDSQARSAGCLTKAAEIKKAEEEWQEAERQAIYDKACALVEKRESLASIAEAVGLFDQLGGYRDCRERKQEAEKEKETLRAELVRKNKERMAAEEAEYERRRTLAEKEARKKRKKKRIACIAVAIIAVIGIAVALVVTQIVIPNNNYKNAEALLAAGQYDDAIAAFEALGDFNDSASCALDARYQKADALVAAGQYDDAIAVFEALGSFNDSANRALDARYQKADALVAAGQYDDAIVVFEALGDYSDAAGKTYELKFDKANALFEEGSHEDAMALYASLGDLETVLLPRLEAIYAAGANEEVSAILAALDTDTANHICYQVAENAEENGNIVLAYTIFESLKQKNYEDASDRYYHLSYDCACELLEQDNFANAKSAFLQARTFLGVDVSDQLEECYWGLFKAQCDARAYEAAFEYYDMVERIDHYDADRSYYRDELLNWANYLIENKPLEHNVLENNWWGGITAEYYSVYDALQEYLDDEECYEAYLEIAYNVYIFKYKVYSTRSDNFTNGEEELRAAIDGMRELAALNYKDSVQILREMTSN